MKYVFDKQLKPLFDASQELKDSKMVLAEKGISKLLKVIAEDDIIYNLVAERILGYDYNRAIQSVVNKELKITEVMTGDGLIAFGFCLLNEIDNHSISIVSFIKNVYGDDSEEQYRAFCSDVIDVFVREIAKLLSDDGEELNLSEDKDPSEMIEELFTNELIERINYVVVNILGRVQAIKKIKPDIKKDIDIICYSIDLCLERLEFVGILGLLSGLKRCLIQLKKFSSEIREIDLILDSINA